MTALDWLKTLPRPWSHERNAPASNSDLRRWLERGSVSMNDWRPKPFDEVGACLDEVTFFPNKPTRVTLWERDPASHPITPAAAAVAAAPPRSAGAAPSSAAPVSGANGTA